MFFLTDGVFFLRYTDTYIDVIYLNKKFYEKKKKIKKKKSLTIQSLRLSVFVNINDILVNKGNGR